MAIIKQGSDHQRRWFDWLPNVVCVTALLTLISAAAAGFLSQRVTTLASTQKIQQEQTDTIASQALSQAKAQWQKKEVELEKELLSAKLKVKAEQTTSANIRKRLVKIQKDLEALKKTAGVQAVKTTAPTPPAAAPKTTTAVAPGTTSPTPTATTPTAAPGTAAPGTAAPKAQPQTVTESSAAPPPAPAPAGVANVPVSDAPPSKAVPAAPKASQSPAAPAVQPVELAPPVNATETAIVEAPDVEENAPGATE